MLPSIAGANARKSGRDVLADVGEWLSLVEHLVRDQGVGGSNPLSPTNLFNSLEERTGFLSTPL